MTLRVTSYLAPSLPEHLFAALADHLAATLRTDVELTFDVSRSGPRPGEDEPFSRGEADIGFLCATSYVWLREPVPPSIELVGAAWAPSDPRADGRAVYFGDVLMRRSSGAAPDDRTDGVVQLGQDGDEDRVPCRHQEEGGLAALVGRRVAYNDEVSLSGYHSLRLALVDAGIDPDRVAFLRSGSHLRSLELLSAGDVDAASIDSTVWRRRRREDPVLARVFTAIAALGPHPVQPVVARRGLPAPVCATIRTALLDAANDPTVASALADAELRRFVPVSDRDYHPLRAQMTKLGIAGHRTA